ncbi:unnamed protein product [Somion occarium]|uniref:Uncharacterized protein n=1 Tax=Somion occarium TaxID=3059160 RepID=A0ABP1DFJ1_9APHY
MRSLSSLPREVRTLLLLALAGDFVHESVVAQASNGDSTCAGVLSIFNVDAKSPCDISKQIYTFCGPGGPYTSTACYCNSITFNLENACRICGNVDPESWAEWSSKYNCSTVAVPTRLPFATPDTLIPRWAYNTLTKNQQFDVVAAVKAAQGWTPIQIAAPFISGVSVAAIALFLFLIYRHRTQRPHHSRHSKSPAWKDAHEHSHRRCFGLFPGRVTVRKATVDTLWQIDQPGKMATNEDIELSQHSRDTSVTSLLPDEQSHRSSSSGNQSSSYFATLVSKISGSSLNRGWYTSGVDKGPEYKKVQVVAEGAKYPGFKIDGTDSTPSRRSTFLSRIFQREDDQQSHLSLPSVIDIRAGPRSNSASNSQSGSSSSHSGPSRKIAPSTRMESIEEGDERSIFSSPARPPRSDFTLSTNDLMTPITPTTYRTAPSSHAHSAYPDSAVLPMSSPPRSAREKRPYIS